MAKTKFQQQVKLSISVAKLANSSRFQILQMKTRISPKSAKPFSAFLPNLPNLAFSELRSQSNTNSESTKSTIFRIYINQRQPRIIISLLPFCANVFVTKIDTTLSFDGGFTIRFDLASFGIPCYNPCLRFGIKTNVLIYCHESTKGL